MVKLLHPLFIVLLISTVSWSQSFEKDSLSIVSILHAQEKAWNSFDIDAFMDGYWRSPDLVFCGAKGPVYGLSLIPKNLYLQTLRDCKITCEFFTF